MRWRQFQFTPLREGRRWRLWLAAGWLCYFNSRPSARGDRSCRRRHAGQAPFQFTPLREGRHFPVATRLSRSIDFNSRPSARGDCGKVSPSILRDISIHAPPRGATPPAQPQIRTACVFQFTPLREGRQVYKSHGFGRTYFNSRPSARGDCRLHNSCSRQFQFQFTPLREGRQLVKVRSCEQLISIHAPPRGATGIRRILPEKICGNFNSRPSARGDGNPWEKRTGGAVLDLSEDKVAGRADHDQLRPALQYHPFVSLFAR